MLLAPVGWRLPGYYVPESKCQELTSIVHDLQRRSTLLLIRSRTVHVDLSQYSEYAHRLADHTKQLTALAQ